MKILIVEDEVTLSGIIKRFLEKHSFHVDQAFDGNSGYSKATINEYDCIILDINLPEKDGFTVAKDLRTESVFTPIIMLTAKGTIEDKIDGFNSGTDDYLAKPFSIKELLLRINALIKRNSRNKETKLTVHNWTIDQDNNQLVNNIDKKTIPVTNKEIGILEYLIRKKGKPVSTEELLEHVWDREVNIFTSTVKTHIKVLRQKIDPQKKIIITVRGKGYKIVD